VNAAQHAASAARLERHFLVLGLDPGSLGGSAVRLREAQEAVRELDEKAAATQFVNAVLAYHAEQANISQLGAEASDLERRARLSEQSVSDVRFRPALEKLAQFGTLARYMESQFGPYHNRDENAVFGLSAADMATVLAHWKLIRERDRMRAEATTAAVTVSMIMARHPEISLLPADALANLQSVPCAA
jgi:hypothetical protein